MEYSSAINTEKILQNLIGIGRILPQFEKYRESFRFHLKNDILFYPNMVFAGNPATGKTTVGRLIGQILYQDGLLTNEHIVEVAAGELVSDYIGETRRKTIELCNQVKGGMLLIDEAYFLNSFEQGKEACEALILFMEKNKDTVIVLMGYHNKMTELLDNNQSLKKRVPNYFVFEDYTNEELAEMFRKRSAEKDLPINDTIYNKAIEYFSSIPRNESFGNAREVDRLLSVLLGNMSRRLQESISAVSSEKQEILPLDFPQYENQMKEIDTDSHSKIDNLQKSVSDLHGIIENIQYNVAMLVQNQANAADVAVLKRENEAFRSDSNMKLMRRYGIDAMIRTYQAICDRAFRIKHTQSEQSEGAIELDALNWVLKRMEKQFKPLGIKLKSTLPGSPVDDSVMVIYGSDGEDVEDEEVIFNTNDDSLKDTVKESVCPAFVWTIPSLIGDVKEWYMEMEKVCIFK